LSKFISHGAGSEEACHHRPLSGEKTRILNPSRSIPDGASQQARKFYPGIADAYRIIRVLSTYSDVVACSRS